MKHFVSLFVAACVGVSITLSAEPSEAQASPVNPYHMFVGTYTNTTSRGIYRVDMNRETGVLGMPVIAAETPDPSWIDLSPDRRFLYAVHPSESQAVGFAVDAATLTLEPLLADVSPPARAPSHLAMDASGRVLITANYGEGRVDIMPVASEGILGARTSMQHAGRGVNPARQTGPHAHHVAMSPDNRFALVCDLGLDRIFTYALDRNAATLVPAATPFVATDPGTGPRHLRFSPEGKRAYVVNEMGGSVSVYDYDASTGSLSHRQTVSSLAPDYQGANTSAEVRVHPNGRFLYVSNRGPNTLAVFGIDGASGPLSMVESVSSGGLVPRNFALSPDGVWLVCANQNSDSLVVFRVDRESGRLSPAGHVATVPRPTCVLFCE